MNGKISAFLTIEGGEAIGNNLDNIIILKFMGISYNSYMEL